MDVAKFTKNPAERAAMMRYLPTDQLDKKLANTLMNVLMKEFGDSGGICLVNADGKSFKESVWDPLHEMFMKNPYMVVEIASDASLLFPGCDGKYGDSGIIIRYLQESRKKHAFIIAEFWHICYSSSLTCSVDYASETASQQLQDNIKKYQEHLQKIEHFLEEHPEIADSSSEVDGMKANLVKSIENFQHHLDNIDEITKIFAELKGIRDSTQFISNHFDFKNTIYIARKINSSVKYAKEFYATSNVEDPPIVYNAQSLWVMGLKSVGRMTPPSQESNEASVRIHELIGDLAKVIA